jgi:glycosyltransferase involved in cell wall biosynthesis
MKSDYSISIITPVYNEDSAIKDFTVNIIAYLKTIADQFEIILIESGSTDMSGIICDQLSDQFDFVHVIHEGRRNGFGAALKLGYKNAQCDLIWLVTVDMPFPLEAIETAIPMLSNYRAVLSYRSNDPRKWIRRFQSFVYNRIIRLFLHLKVKHINSGFKLYRREDIQKMELVSNGWFIDAEMICWLQKLKLPFAQIPVPLIDRSIGQSKVSSSTFISVLKEMFSFMKLQRKKQQTTNYDVAKL